MALPVTITGISTAVAPVGPFKTNVAATSTFTITTPDTSSSDFIGSGTGNQKRYQTFTTTSGAATVFSVEFYLAKSGTPTDNILVDIYAVDGSGVPTGASLGTSTGLASTSIGTGANQYTFTFPTPPAVSASTQYAAVLSRSGSFDNLNVVRTYGSFTNINSAEFSGAYNGTTWTHAGNDDHRIFVTFGGTPTDAWYFFGRDGTTATTLQAFKSTAPDTSWASVSTKTGFTTAILNLAAYQVGNVIHLLVQDGTASTSQAVKYVSFNAATDTFATTETVMAAVAVTGQVASGWGASLVVRSDTSVVAFYNAVQTKTSGTFRARVSYRIRSSGGSWGTETTVDGGTAATDSVLPIAVLGASNRVHFIWASPTNVNNRTLSAANALNTATTSASLTNPGDGVSYDRSGTTKVVVTSNTTGQTVQRFDSSDNPTASYSTPTAANATLPHRIGTFPNTDDVTIVYRNSADSDLYSIKSSDDGATFGTAVSFFVGTIASADANVSRSSSGSVYARGSNNVVGYIVNDGGTLKYNENIVSTSSTNYTDTIAPSALPITGQSITGVYVVGSVAYTDTIAASSVPINGATVAPVYTANYSDTLTASALPISGATLTADVFAIRDTISPSSVPLVGATLADLLAYRDAISPSALPITGQAIAPVYTARYADTLTASSLPIGGQAITPVYSAGRVNYTDTIAPSALPLVGSIIAPVYSADGTVLNTADNIYVGSALAAKVYLGTVQVWPPSVAALSSPRAHDRQTANPG